MTNRVHSWQPAPGGFEIEVEVENAYTDGSSRFDRIFVAHADMPTGTREEAQQAALDAFQRRPLDQLIGQALTAPAQTKAVLEVAMVALYEDWQRWKITRLEAEARLLASAIITALTSRENTAWTQYATAVNAWRLAT